MLDKNYKVDQYFCGNIIGETVVKKMKTLFKKERLLMLT